MRRGSGSRVAPTAILPWRGRGVKKWGRSGSRKGQDRFGIGVAHCDLSIASSLSGGTAWLEKITEDSVRPLDGWGNCVEELGNNGMIDAGHLMWEFGQYKHAHTYLPLGPQIGDTGQTNQKKYEK